MRSDRLAYASARGFASAEIVVIVTVLLLLAAFALPRLTSRENEARVSAITSLRGSIKSTAALAHAQWVASGKPTTISMEGQTIHIINGYPDAATLPRALPDTTGFLLTATPSVATYRKTGAPEPEQCAVVYTAATVQTSASVSVPVIKGC